MKKLKSEASKSHPVLPFRLSLSLLSSFITLGCSQNKLENVFILVLNVNKSEMSGKSKCGGAEKIC